MKRIVIVSAIILGLGVPSVIAQQQVKEKREKKEVNVDVYVQRRAEVLKNDLQLSDKQTLQVAEIYKKNAPVRLGMNASKDINITEMNAREIADVEGILTADQKVRYQELRELQKTRKLEKRGGAAVERERGSVDAPRKDLREDLKKD